MGFGRFYSFPRDINLYEEIYEINPQQSYDVLKDDLKNILRDIFHESSNIGITDDNIERWIDYALRHSYAIRESNYRGIKLERVDITEFKLKFDKKYIILN